MIRRINRKWWVRYLERRERLTKMTYLHLVGEDRDGLPEPKPSRMCYGVWFNHRGTATPAIMRWGHG